MPAAPVTSQEFGALETDATNVYLQLTPEEDHKQLHVDIIHWRLKGMDANVARALQARQGGGATGDTVVSTADRAAVWGTILSDKLPVLAKAAQRLLAMHATSCGPERNWSEWRSVYRPNR